MWKNDIIKFIKFSIVGVSNTLISFVSFYILFEFFGVYYLASSTIGYLIGLINSYFWNLRWTFKHSHSNEVLFKFVIVNVVALSIKIITISLLVEVLNIPEIYSELLAMSLAIIINFGGNRFWTFSKNK